MGRIRASATGIIHADVPSSFSAPSSTASRSWHTKVERATAKIEKNHKDEHKNSSTESLSRFSTRLRYSSDILNPSSLSKKEAAQRSKVLALHGEERGSSIVAAIEDPLDIDDRRKILEQVEHDRQQRHSQQVQDSVMRSISLAAARAAEAHGSLDKQRAVWMSGQAARKHDHDPHGCTSRIFHPAAL